MKAADIDNRNFFTDNELLDDPYRDFADMRLEYPLRCERQTR